MGRVHCIFQISTFQPPIIPPTHLWLFTQTVGKSFFLNNTSLLFCPYLSFVSADNVKVSADGSTMVITRVTSGNHGTYRCVASNPFGITHTIVSLIVKGQLRFHGHVTS